MKIKNEEKIKKITMMPTVITKCRIGQDWFKNKLEIVFYPNRYYPDYMEVEDWLMKNIDGKELNIEGVIDEVYKYFIDTYDPKEIHITDIVRGNKVHFDVIVEK